MRHNDSEDIVSNELLGTVRLEVQKFKALMKGTFDAHCGAGLYTLKLHLVDAMWRTWKGLGAWNC